MPKVAEFTLELIAVRNLQSDNEVYLQWSRREKTRTVVVQNGTADFTGEIVQRNSEARTGGIRRKLFHRHSSVVYLPEPLHITLRQKKPGMLARDRNLGTVHIDFARFTDANKKPLVLFFNGSHAALIAPVLHVLVSCSWTEAGSERVPDAMAQLEPQLENPQDRPGAGTGPQQSKTQTTTAAGPSGKTSSSQVASTMTTIEEEEEEKVHRSPAPPAVAVK